MVVRIVLIARFHTDYELKRGSAVTKRRSLANRWPASRPYRCLNHSYPLAS